MLVLDKIESGNLEKNKDLSLELKTLKTFIKKPEIVGEVIQD